MCPCAMHYQRERNGIISLYSGIRKQSNKKSCSSTATERLKLGNHLVLHCIKRVNIKNFIFWKGLSQLTQWHCYILCHTSRSSFDGYMTNNQTLKEKAFPPCSQKIEQWNCNYNAKSNAKSNHLVNYVWKREDPSQSQVKQFSYKPHADRKIPNNRSQPLKGTFWADWKPSGFRITLNFPN